MVLIFVLAFAFALELNQLEEIFLPSAAFWTSCVVAGVVSFPSSDIVIDGIGAPRPTIQECIRTFTPDLKYALARYYG